MACFYPLKAYKVKDGIKFHDNGSGEPIELPCGQCIGCRLERSRQWAMRCMNEASMHEDNCFITLTYNDENIPGDGSLRVSDFQKFMKRLRKRYKGKKIRFYHCGEYGDKNNRPHYHAIIFGFNFDDWTYLFNSPSGFPVYTSDKLTEIWGKGFTTIGEVTFESAAYIARYVVKKINGKMKDQIDLVTGLKPYERYNHITGEITEVLPEYATMSRRPGIGYSWINNYKSDVYPKDFTTVNAIKCKPPKYYDEQIKKLDPELYDDIKAGRKLNRYMIDDSKQPSLSAREAVKKAQNKQLRRSI